MGINRSAQALGRLGGLARARALSKERRRQIASQGGLSRSLSRHASPRVEDNFKWLEAARALREAGRRLALAKPNELLVAAAAVAMELEAAAFQPVLVGGMALVLLGSQRVPKHYEFLVTVAGPPIDTMVNSMYRRDLHLVTRFTPVEEVLRTIDTMRVAVTKIKRERPNNLTFYNSTTRLRIDLFLDYPFPASDLVQRAAKVLVMNLHLRVAAEEDLVRLKKMAKGGRNSASDAQDLEFLARIKRKPA